MSARDELRGTLANTICNVSFYPRLAQPYLLGGDMSNVLDRTAETLLEAGYRKPRTITTAEELDALPFGSVILDPTGLSLHKNEFTGWRASNGAKDIDAEMLEREALPAKVLHEPEAEQ
ncbi:hypothetical protein SEA_MIDNIGHTRAIN_49 [Arthrobacter phage MidnightRain]|nr:hypothetical protein SEA_MIDNIGHTRAIN_49 [Arthrobacter phage MidnightRain]